MNYINILSLMCYVLLGVAVYLLLLAREKTDKVEQLERDLHRTNQELQRANRLIENALGVLKPGNEEREGGNDMKVMIREEGANFRITLKYPSGYRYRVDILAEGDDHAMRRAEALVEKLHKKHFGHLGESWDLSGEPKRPIFIESIVPLALIYEDNLLESIRGVVYKCPVTMQDMVDVCKLTGRLAIYLGSAEAAKSAVMVLLDERGVDYQDLVTVQKVPAGGVEENS